MRTKKTAIAVILILSSVLSLTLTLVLPGCNQAEGQGGQHQEETRGSAAAESEAVTTVPETAAADTTVLPEVTEPPEEPGDAPLHLVPVFYGWSPQPSQKRVPAGMSDVVANALDTFVNYGRMNFYIGVVDLLDPVNGYRHIDAAGGIHPSSMIKVWIAEYAYLQILAGNGDVSEIIAGSPMSYHLNQMMRVSCNAATAHIIARYGRDEIDRWLKDNYGYTRLHSDLRGYNHGGQPNISSVSDSIALLEKIWHNRHSEPYATVINHMYNSRTRAKLPAALSRFRMVEVATKTGSYVDAIANADHDMGIVVERDEHGNIVVAYAIAIYTFSPNFTPTFSIARPTIISVVQHVHDRLRFYAYDGYPPLWLGFDDEPAPEPEPTAIPEPVTPEQPPEIPVPPVPPEELPPPPVPQTEAPKTQWVP